MRSLWNKLFNCLKSTDSLTQDEIWVMTINIVELLLCSERIPPCKALEFYGDIRAVVVIALIG